MTEYVCASCIGESGLKEYIEMNADESYCDFCDESHGNVHAIPVDGLRRGKYSASPMTISAIARKFLDLKFIIETQ